MIRMTLRKSTVLAVVVGQLAVVHHLQQDVEESWMSLLDLVEQQHRSAGAGRWNRSAGRPGRSRHTLEARRSAG
jgi:hypothetical protein